MYKTAKTTILRTSFASSFLNFSEWLNVLRTTITNPESVSDATNNYFAARLTTGIAEDSGEKYFVDVGSHIGSIIASVHANKPNTKIIGIEAIPEKVIDLKINFPYAEIYEYALGDRAQEIDFFIDVERSGYSSLINNESSQGYTKKKITVNMVTLDSLCSDKAVDVIKIDVEGAELGVIKGSGNVMSNQRPLIMFESGPGERDIKEDLWNAFNAKDYEVSLPVRLAHDCDPMSCDSFLDAHQYPRSTTNYFAVPRERKGEFRDKARRILGISQ